MSDPGAFYLDANPLMRWAETLASQNEPPRTVTIGTRTVALVESAATVAASEVTIAELLDNVHTYFRNGARKEHNLHWVNRVYDAFMEWIEAGSIEVLDTPPRAISNAIHYFEMATVEFGRSLRTWDAVHIAIATEWARERESSVAIVTSNGSISTFLDVFPEFGEHVEVVDFEQTDPAGFTT